MKIGVVTEYYYPLLGGITEHVHHFCLEAKKLGHEPVIITSDAGRDPHVKEDVRVIRVGKSIPMISNGSIARITFDLNSGKKLRKIFKEEKFDILHIHSPFVPTLPIISQRWTNTVTIGTFHTQFNSSGSLRLFKGLLKKYFDALDGKIAVSKLCIDSMSRYFVGDYRIIPNGVDIDKFSPAAGKIKDYSDGKLNIFFLSRLEPRNGLGFLIEAFKKIREKRDDCRLIIGGDGPFMGYYKSLVPNKIKSDVHFIGRINGRRPEFYATSDVFCFPATKASFGITILEGMASAKPVVAFSMEAFEGILKNGEEGVLCGKPGSDNLAETINSLLDSPAERKRLGDNARRRSEDFAWSKVTKEIINYYEEVRANYSK